jgi:hypothetical protein
VRLRIGIAGALAGLGVVAASASGAIVSRLEWQPNECELSRHRTCAFAPGPEGHAHRFVTLVGNLRAFAPDDASLYAIYLGDRGDLGILRDLLARHGSPASWNRQDRDVSGFLGNHALLEWLPVETNGEVVVRADEANVPGKRLVAVVNESGEILGTHPLWAETGSFASLR